MAQIISMKYNDKHIMIETDESELLELAEKLKRSEKLELLGNEREDTLDRRGLLEKIKTLIKKPVREVDQFFDELIIEEIVQNCNILTKAFMKLKQDNEISPSKAHAEFGLKFSGEGNVYVTKVSGESNFKISVDWELK